MAGFRKVRGVVAAGLLLVLCAASAGPLAAATDGPDDGPARYRELLQSGNLNNNLGRFELAEQAFRDALAACENAFGPEHPDCADPMTRLALEISNQERFEEAELVFQRAESLSREASSPLDHPRYLTYRAMGMANRRRFSEAFDLVTEANQRRQGVIQTTAAAAAKGESGARQALDHGMADLAHGLYVQAGMALRLGRPEDAKVTAHLARRLVLRVDGVPKWWTAVIDELLAVIDLRQGNIEAAEERLKLALETKRVALGNTRAVALSHLTLGAVYNEGQRDLDALQAMRPGLAIVNEELGEVPGVDVERLIPFLRSAHSETLRETDKRAALSAEMFVASQLVRSGGTAKAVARMAARFASGRPEVAALVRQAQEAARRRDQLRLDLGRAAISRGGQGSERRLADLRKAYAEAVKSASTLEEDLAEAFPDYARLAIPSPVPAKRLGELLGPDEALLHIVLGEEESFGFLVRGDAILAAPLGIGRADIESAVRELRQPFEEQGASIQPFDMAAAHALYRRLFSPFEEQLAGVRHLIVAPSGALLSLPFSLLITQPTTGLGPTDYARAAWLTKDMAVSVMPSVRAFADLRGLVKPSTAPLPFLGFGDPAVSGGKGMSALAAYCRTGGAIPPELLRGLLPLPETAQELRHVAGVLGAKPDALFLGNDATEEKLRGLDLDQYRILYFATHGLLPGELRCQAEPGLAFSPPQGPNDDPARDGLLDASEIADLKLDAELVVLSACNTGGGGSGQFGGEALSGLVRAFFQAGARSLLVSHWQVDSIATTRLMSGLFDRLAADPAGGAAEALRRAQIALIQNPETAHPAFWGAFTLVGASAGGGDRPALSALEQESGG